ncbi:hypothetical protein H8356DRAFT_1739727 [Neocallimastix lanati (nom. inval.)]|jgi:hypothetical protein|nr:hypothetical protein H8356DRAFT_1739727 [Neocallimastix sp. JGI-2020a]
MFWRKRSTSKEKDYEKILADIDFEIKQIEDKLRQIKLREDRSIVTWLYYSIPLYTVFLIGYGFFIYQLDEPLPIRCIKGTPLVIGLFLIIFIKKFISIWYKKQQMSEEERSGELKKEQKEILEELKSKLKYYQTKNLIEKYELQEEPVYAMNNGMPMMNPQMNGQRMNPNQMRNPKMMDRKQQIIGGHNLSRQRSMPVVLTNGKQQFADMRFNQQYPPPQYGVQQPSNPNERKWIDKLMDAIVGDVNEADSKYALVCNFCYTHCGLALPEEYKTFKYICPNCKKLNDNAKKYNIKDPKSNQSSVVNEDHMLPPPSAPIEKSNNLKVLPIKTQSKSAPVSPQKSNFSISDNNNNTKPNLQRRSSTLLEEMDDSTNTDTTTFNQITPTPVNVNPNDVINEGTDENLDQDINGDINQFEKEIEEEKEVINYQEENDINNTSSINTVVEEGEKIENNDMQESNAQEETQSDNEIINDDNKQEPIIPNPVKEQQNIVNDNEQKIEENLQQ